MTVDGEENGKLRIAAHARMLYIASYNSESSQDFTDRLQEGNGRLGTRHRLARFVHDEKKTPANSKNNGRNPDLYAICWLFAVRERLLECFFVLFFS